MARPICKQLQQFVECGRLKSAEDSRPEPIERRIQWDKFTLTRDVPMHFNEVPVFVAFSQGLLTDRAFDQTLPFEPVDGLLNDRRIDSKTLQPACDANAVIDILARQSLGQPSHELGVNHDRCTHQHADGVLPHGELGIDQSPHPHKVARRVIIGVALKSPFEQIDAPTSGLRQLRTQQLLRDLDVEIAQQFEFIREQLPRDVFASAHKITLLGADASNA